MSPVDQLQEDSKVLKQVITKLYGEVEELRGQVQALIRARYGRKAETFAPGQMTLFESSASDEVAEAAQEENVPTTSSKKHGRSKPAKELPRKKIVYEVAESKLSFPDCGIA